MSSWYYFTTVIVILFGVILYKFSNLKIILAAESLIPEYMYVESHGKPVLVDMFHLMCLIFTDGLQLLPPVNTIRSNI